MTMVACPERGDLSTRNNHGRTDRPAAGEDRPAHGYSTSSDGRNVFDAWVAILVDIVMDGVLHNLQDASAPLDGTSTTDEPGGAADGAER